MSEENNNNGGEENGNTPWIDDGGTFGDMAKAPEAVRTFVEKKGLKDLSSMTVSYQEMESKLGSMPNTDNMVALPVEGNQESFDNFADRCGRPKSANDYLFTKTEKDVNVPDELLNSYRQYAYKEGMSQDAFAKTVRFQLDASNAAMDNYNSQVQKNTDDAQKAIRGRFNTEDEYNDYTKKALGYAEAYKVSDTRSLADVFEDKGLMQDPEILDVLGSLADKLVEDPMPRGTTRSNESRQAQLAAIRTNPAYLDPMHPEHQKVFKEWQTLILQKEG